MNITNITIRPMRPDEYRVLREVRLRALKDTPLAFGSTLERESALTDEQWAQWAVKRTMPGESVTFLALDGDACCGIIGSFGDNDFPSQACIVSMWVAPAARRQGIGRRLMQAVEDWARQIGFAQLSLDVTETNEAAIRLYERCGFHFTGESDRYPNHPDLRELFMLKPL